MLARIESGETDPQLVTVLKILRPLGKTLAVVDMPTNVLDGTVDGRNRSTLRRRLPSTVMRLTRRKDMPLLPIAFISDIITLGLVEQ
jgi:predicted transcriptional regulator